MMNPGRWRLTRDAARAIRGATNDHPITILECTHKPPLRHSDAVPAPGVRFINEGQGKLSIPVGCIGTLGHILLKIVRPMLPKDVSQGVSRSSVDVSLLSPSVWKRPGPVGIFVHGRKSVGGSSIAAQLPANYSLYEKIKRRWDRVSDCLHVCTRTAMRQQHHILLQHLLATHMHQAACFSLPIGYSARASSMWSALPSLGVVRMTLITRGSSSCV
jgi:hypothetical protein